MMLALLFGILPAQRAEGATRTANPEARMHPMQKCMDEMKLTDAQMQKFAAAKAQYEKQSNSISAEIKNLNIDLTEAVKAENFKRAKELNKQISDKNLALKNARIDMMTNILKELTKEQKDIWKKNAPMMMGSMGMGMGMHHWQSARGARRFPHKYSKQDHRSRMYHRGKK
jgi:hypothetical protein